MADVPFAAITVLFWRDPAASSAGSFFFSSIHTNVMPFFWNQPVPDSPKML
ncbi:MAG: hypothetical protein KGK16_12515 [Bradyrhizobium sp.]|uniref:hypothetical protein n=1 Tax=Bradyrhizobium sp. TaxID=376 RepID=UPI001EC56DC6|nr:hypothetical protein [Bradyrhizobium sp.]MBU6457262.1 hypothetical protein [Bradyrhizobium sp.]MDE2331588.1 hypothetical protein [Bradyrhizobium sp.]MDE2602823.1 hypothetical protein [Bradyrhizobium sp.]